MFTTVEQSIETINVVIVEDYKLTRVGLRSTINEFENISVVGEAEDAIQGLEIIKKEHPQVVLMDLGLPGMNGIATLEKIRQHKEYSSIPVMFLTADATEDTVIAAGRLGADGYIKKPYMPQDFLERVENVL